MTDESKRFESKFGPTTPVRVRVPMYIEFNAEVPTHTIKNDDGSLSDLTKGVIHAQVRSVSGLMLGKVNIDPMAFGPDNHDEGCDLHDVDPGMFPTLVPGRYDEPHDEHIDWPPYYLVEEDTD